MRIGKFQFFKKDIHSFDCFHSIRVLNTETNEEFILSHKCSYMFYTRKEEENIIFNVFKKAIDLLNNGFYFEKVDYFNKNNLTIENWY